MRGAGWCYRAAGERSVGRRWGHGGTPSLGNVAELFSSFLTPIFIFLCVFVQRCVWVGPCPSLPRLHPPCPLPLLGASEDTSPRLGSLPSQRGTVRARFCSLEVNFWPKSGSEHGLSTSSLPPANPGAPQGEREPALLVSPCLGHWVSCQDTFGCSSPPSPLHDEKS